MSRSYKKNKVIKYARFITKAEANRRLRRVNKIRVSLNLEPLKFNELVNPYDINDCIWRAKTKEEEKDKLFRK